MIIRTRKDKDYFAAKNHGFVDKRLSWETRGLLGFLLTKPDDWEVRVGALIRAGNAGRDKMRRMLKELEEAGYLQRQRLQREDGQFEWISVIYETPQPDRPTIDGFSGHGATIDVLAVDGSPVDGKPVDLTSTDSPSTDSPSTEESESSSSAPSAPDVDDEAFRALTEIPGWSEKDARQYVKREGAPRVLEVVKAVRTLSNAKNPGGLVRHALDGGYLPQTKAAEELSGRRYVEGEYAFAIEH